MNQKQELLFSVTIHDCDVQAFCSGGPGGQHQNKTASAIRVIHKPSGAIGESREMKSQFANKKLAFRRMAESEKFQRWARIEVARRSGEPSVGTKVRKEMSPENLRIETHDEKRRWTVNAELLPSEQEVENLF